MKERFKDTDLREALRRQYADTPQLPADFMDRIQRRKPALRHRTLPLFISGIAASILIAFLLWPKGEEAPIVQPEQKPILVQQTEETQSVEDEAVTNEPVMVVAEARPLVKPAKKHKQATKQKEPDEASDLQKRIAELTIVPTSADLGPNTLRLIGTKEPKAITTSITEEDKEESVPPISPERQALVDIFLAEEALQVVYEQQAQTEELRAFVADLEGKEIETSHFIIAF